MTRPLRVATVITRLEGGAGIQAFRGARALDPASFQVTVVTGSGDTLLVAAAESGLETVADPSLRAPIDPLRDVRALRWLTSLFRERQFDVVHTHCAKAGTLGRLAAHRSHVPRIVHTYHGFPFHGFQSAARRAAYVSIERRLGQVTDVALCVGTGVAAEAVRRGLVPPDRIRAIGVAVEGADAPAAPPAPHARARARLALGLPADATVVGAVGRLTYQKAPEDFVAALSKLGPEVTGVWIGGGELWPKVSRLARSVPGGRVILAGERADVPALLPAFDVFALPSRYEGLPTAVVEAMISGVPVVATAVNAVPDVVSPGETGLLVPAHSPGLMAQAVRYLLDSPATAARMAAAARRQLGERYGERALAQALAAAYDPACADDAPVPPRPLQPSLRAPDR
jgi:glycosyltransferase involved in cell wall biosynthesis